MFSDGFIGALECCGPARVRREDEVEVEVEEGSGGREEEGEDDGRCDEEDLMCGADVSVVVVKSPVVWRDVFLVKTGGSP